MSMAVSVPRYTVDDLERLPEDGSRYELLDGMLIVTPAPRQAHQVIAGRIQGLLFSAFGVNGRARVVGPGVISMPPGTQLEPDILVYPARFAPDEHWVKNTEHWLAAEVLSRSSRFYDRELKRDAYFQLGVQEVWLVDIEDRSVDVWRSRTEHDVVRDVLRWRVPTTDTVVPIDLAAVFAGLT